MKKIISSLLIAVFAMSVPTAAHAEATRAGFPEGYPDVATDYQTYTPQNTNNVIPSWGYIGLDAELTPDVDPDVPPEYIPDDSSAFINVEVPVQTMWAVFQGGGGVVTAPEYTIKNLDAKSTLSVTVESYTLQNSVVVPDGLTLNLTGGLATANIVGLENNTVPSTVAFRPADVLTFSFGGNYTGSYSSTALQPKYDLVLKFEIVEVAAS